MNFSPVNPLISFNPPICPDLDTAQPLASSRPMRHPLAMPTALETFLSPLVKLAARFPDVEGAVIWADGDAWAVQDDQTELLDAEEIAFYAEGLLMEGFGMIWQAMAEDSNPREPDHILLMFWQGAAPPLPDPPEGWRVTAQGAWMAPQQEPQ